MDFQSLSPVITHVDDNGIVYSYPSSSLEICRLVLSFDAGSFFQPHPLVADAANRLFSEATLRQSSQQIAEFLDYRGIMIEKSKDTYTADISVYMLRKHAREMIPVLREMLTEPLFGEQGFEVYKSKTRQQIATQLRKTSSMAFRLFYETLYGKGHPLARFATPDDVDRLSLSEVKDFFHGHYDIAHALIVLSGGLDDATVNSCGASFGGIDAGKGNLVRCSTAPMPLRQRCVHYPMDSAQTTVRIGRILPFHWDDKEYAAFMVLNTLLGGYFGSRLMNNIREDKGYTYGVYSATALSRDDSKFFISMDVGNDVAFAAAEETYNEIDRLQQELVGVDELEMVRQYMKGDFIRTVDGVFERGERFMQMANNGITELFTQNYFDAIEHVSPQDIQRLARTYLRKEDLYEIIVGAGVPRQ
ncbi:MAG: insulinase family protein [Bacteroidales bacterium]|nr:insulinase family protein [Bacteroidales bacterium]